MTIERRYYSIRTGRNSGGLELDLPQLKRLFLSVFDDFRERYYFQQAFGYVCVDAGQVVGTAGRDVEAFVLRTVRKPDLWPLDAHIEAYSEDDLFDMIELLHDLVAKPEQGGYHEWGGCGWHYRTFDTDQGRAEYRQEVTALLKDYGPGYEINAQGEIVRLADADLAELLDSSLQELDPTNVEGRMRAAVAKFRRRQASVDERRDAVRDLADVLEYLRPQLDKVLTSKDESDLFNIANNFGIRHHNQKQKTGYDQEVWLDSLFYYYLNMVRTVCKLLVARQADS